MSKIGERYCKQLVERFPFLKPVLAEHLADFDELLPHLFFGDLTRYVIADFIRVSDGGALADWRLQELLDELESGLTGRDDEVDNLISVSFLENLPYPGEVGDGIRDLLGPASRAQLERIWRGGTSTSEESS